MIVEQQDEYECALATLGALADIPLVCVRAKADELAGGSWANLFTSNDKMRMWRVLYDLCEEVGLPKGLFIPIRFKPMPGLKVREVQTIPKKGRGAVTVTCREQDSTVIRTHVMPFEDGLVYDPNWAVTTGETLHEFRRRWTMGGLTDIKVVRVVKLVGEKK